MYQQFFLNLVKNSRRCRGEHIISGGNHCLCLVVLPPPPRESLNAAGTRAAVLHTKTTHARARTISHHAKTRWLSEPTGSAVFLYENKTSLEGEVHDPAPRQGARGRRGASHVPTSASQRVTPDGDTTH